MRKVVKEIFISISLVLCSRFVGNFGAIIDFLISRRIPCLPDELFKCAFVIFSGYLFCKYFSKHFNDFFIKPNYKNTVAIFIILFPGLLINIIKCDTFLIPINVAMELFFAAVIEEMQFRGMACSYYIKKADTKMCIIRLLTHNGLFFGLCHIQNILAGQSIKYSVVQSISAIASGIMYTIVFLICGSILPPVILHFVNNYICYARYQTLFFTDAACSISLLSIVFLVLNILCTIIFMHIVLGNDRYKYIINLWNKKWHIG